MKKLLAVVTLLMIVLSSNTYATIDVAEMAVGSKVIKEKVTKKKIIKKKHAKKKTKWKYIGVCRVTHYCPQCNDPVGSYKSASGKTLRSGMVACSWLPMGTVLSIEGEQFVVTDICGTEAIDIFIDSSVCYCSENSYKKIFIKKGVNL